MARKWKPGTSRFASRFSSIRKSISTSSILPSANSSLRSTATSRSSMPPSARRNAFAVFCQSATITPSSGTHGLVVQRDELGTDAVGQLLQLPQPVLLGRVDLAVGIDELTDPVGLLGGDDAALEDDGAQRLEQERLEGRHAGAGLLARLEEELHLGAIDAPVGEELLAEDLDLALVDAAVGQQGRHGQLPPVRHAQCSLVRAGRHAAARLRPT